MNIAYTLGIVLAATASCLAQNSAPREVRFHALAALAPDSPQRLEIARVQILLDRAQFRPGKIDALGGEFTQKAADRYCIVLNLPPGTRLDTSSIPRPYREYTVTTDDVAWVGESASTPAEQEKLKRLPYTSTWEAVSERFHCDIDFIRELNPTIKQDPVPGTVLLVPDVNDFRMADVLALQKQRIEEAKARKAAKDARNRNSDESAMSPVANTLIPSTPLAAPREPARRVVLLREPRLIEVYQEDRLIACFPCTPGSTEIPVPPGHWKVTSNALLPYFRWDKSVLDNGVRSDTAFNLPPGPNNPVGIVWMGIDRPSVGMHGTTSPDQIGRNQSHGCIRLANWDAFLLCQLIGKGTPVEVR